MDIGQGSRGAPPSCIQLSSVLGNIFRKLGHGANTHDPLTQDVIHTMGALFMDNTYLYEWKKMNFGKKSKKKL